MKDKIHYMDSDILIVGSGIAGLQAALTVARNGKQPLLVSKSPVGRANNTTLAGGGFTYATDHFSPEAHLNKTMESGKMLNNRSLVEYLVKHSPRTVKEFINTGLTGISHKRGFFCRSNALIGGPNITALLVQACREAGVKFLENVMITDLILMDDACHGAVGFQKRTGEFFGLHAKAVLLATGGAGAIYAPNDNAPGTTGDGYILCLQAGLELMDMEFVQFYPLVYAGSGRGQMILPSAFADLGTIVNRHGEDLKEKYQLHEKPIAIVSRDRFSQALFRELAQGNGVDGTILLDLREVDETRIPLNDNLKARFNKKISYNSKPVKIRPACHHTMGGVVIDAGGCTGLKGLYAAGEVVGGIHGANRMGGNALSEGLVFGELVAQSACAYADSHKRVSGYETMAEGTINRRFHAMDPAGKAASDVVPLMKQLREVLWEKVGIIREGNSLKEGIEKIDEIFHGIQKQRASNPFEACRIFECANAALTGKAIALSALERTESRGSHCRNDFSAEDENWLKHIHIQMIERKPEISRITTS